MNGSNPLHPRHMRSLERRAELCRILALGLIRWTKRTCDHEADENGEIPLHKPSDQSGHATREQRRMA